MDQEEWWRRLKNLKIEQLKNELCRLVAKRNLTPNKPFVARSRLLKWRREELEEMQAKSKRDSRHFGRVLVGLGS